MASKTIKVQQTGSAMRREHTQRETLIGLKLNKIGRVSDLPDTPMTRGMIEQGQAPRPRGRREIRSRR